MAYGFFTGNEFGVGFGVIPRIHSKPLRFLVTPKAEGQGDANPTS